jgi:PAS domain S-box-containing protein
MKNNQEQLYTLLQSIEGVVWEADTDMRQFTFVSNQVQSILGFSPKDCLERPEFWKEQIHQEDRQVAAGYRELLNGDIKSRSFEYRMIRADGHIVWIKDNVTVIYKEDKPFLLRGIMLDNTIAERLRALEHLEREILRLNSGLTASLQDVLSSYMQGLEALFPQMQCSFHRIKKGRIANAISPSLPPAYIAAITGLQIGENEGSCGTAAALKRQVIVNDIETDPRWEKYRPLALGHHLRACWSNPVIDAEGEVMATLAMYYHEPKLPGEEELKVMERAVALLRIILENRQKTEIINEANMLMLQSQELAHFGNWCWDIRHDIVSWSPALYTIYGLDPKDFKATFMGYQERLHPEDRPGIYRIIEKVLTTGEDAEFEERIIRPGGEVRYLRSWAKLKSDLHGAPLEMIGACLDITERVSHIETIKQRNRQLLEINEQHNRVIKTLHALEQSQADNSRMMKIVAHDLRSPIGAISLSAAHMIKKGYPEKDRKILEIIKRAADDSLDLVGDLLHVPGRAEEMRKEPVDLKQMLRYCTDILLHKAKAKGQQIRIQAKPATVFIDNEKMWRVVSNLIANAVKFSPHKAIIAIRLKENPGHIVIEVEDQGIGIPEAVKDKIFDMFTEAKRPGTAGELSFGMGLAISKQIVEAHGGKIWFESKPGSGTVFYVELPLQ